MLVIDLLEIFIITAYRSRLDNFISFANNYPEQRYAPHRSAQPPTFRPSTGNFRLWLVLGVVVLFLVCVLWSLVSVCGGGVVSVCFCAGVRLSVWTVTRLLM
ncbi:hypothetical protein, partial [Micrococcus endophyticus]|uniref:hypothetical protein n=1 Tax=Micrococcus endophyticus TaxID=455343 RepID=UPI0031CDC081